MREIIPLQSMREQDRTPEQQQRLQTLLGEFEILANADGAASAIAAAGGNHLVIIDVDRQSALTITLASEGAGTSGPLGLVFTPDGTLQEFRVDGVDILPDVDADTRALLLGIAGTAFTLEKDRIEGNLPEGGIRLPFVNWDTVVVNGQRRTSVEIISPLASGGSLTTRLSPNNNNRQVRIDEVRGADGTLRSTVSTIFADDISIIKDENGVGRIRVKDAPAGLDFVDAGEVIGDILGSRLAKGNRLVGVLYSAGLKTLGSNLGDALNATLFGSTIDKEDIVETVFYGLDRELVQNLKAAGLGAISSFLTAELVNALGLDGFAGEAVNSAAGAVIGQIVSGIAAGTKVADIFKGLDFAQVGNALGGFLGSKLASELVSFDTIGGQIGSAFGAAVGSIAAVALVTGSGALASQFAFLGTGLAGPVGAAIGAFLGFIAGGLIGSLFGGTPRSGADVSWNETSGRFDVANVYSKKGGSKDAARSMAAAVAETFNAVLGASGGTLLSPQAVQAGNYGMRKSDLVYRPTSTRDKDAISFRLSSKSENAMGRMIGYGVVQGLTDPDFQIAGGDVYVKRAIYNSFELGAINAGDFDTSILLGNISSAQSYAGYLANAGVIGALVAAEPGSVFALDTLINLARADELGLTRRHRSDWFGGFGFLLKDAGANAATTSFGFDYDPVSGQVSRLIGLGEYVLGDAIDIAGQKTIEAGSASDIVDLRSSQLVNQIGYTVDGTFNDDIAVSGVDFTALTNSVTFSANALRTSVTIAVTSDGIAEATERFEASLSNASDMRIMGDAAVGTLIDGVSALPTLLVGNSYAWENDGYAIFRLSLSKAATETVTVALALADGKASGAGVDYGAVDPANIQVSHDGVTWVDATSATFTAGVTELFVRTAVVADNMANPDYVEGGSAPEFLNIEGNERFSLTATVTAGAAALANGAQTVSGTGTIVDGAGTEPLVWIDDVIVDEASGQARFIISRSRTMSTATTVGFATSDRRVLDIDIAATVDGGDGIDTIYASNLGDNIFGGAGNDTLYGGRLDDWLLGGDGDDLLEAGTADSTALGGDGNYLDGGDGNDIVRGREGSDWLEGGAGVDIITGGAGDDILTGGAGDGDDLKGGTGADQYLLRAGDGIDVAEEDATGAPVASGTGDAITQRMASIEAWKANPFAAGALRPDWLGESAGVQQGTVAGGEDAVVLGVGIGIGDIRMQRSGTSGAPGNDLIIQIMQTDDEGVESFSGTQLTIRDWFSNPFKRVEWLKFADGTEIRIGDITSFIVGGSGDDVLIGTDGNDFVYGGAGNDKLFLLGGDDIGNGGSGDDMVAGDAGRDLIIGGVGADQLIGGSGSDAISGDAGADDIYGGGDRDILSGGRGDGDLVVGGAGDDTFKYARGDGRDMVFDDFADEWDVSGLRRASGTRSPATSMTRRRARSPAPTASSCARILGRRATPISGGSDASTMTARARHSNISIRRRVRRSPRTAAPTRSNSRRASICRM